MKIKLEMTNLTEMNMKMQMKVMVLFETWEKLMARIVLHVEQVGLNLLLEMWHNW